MYIFLSAKEDLSLISSLAASLLLVKDGVGDTEGLAEQAMARARGEQGNHMCHKHYSSCPLSLASILQGAPWRKYIIIFVDLR